ncbi:WS/DGAT/MGAT family O-acyltransferase [Williamsia sterculiae]|nr:wax ester/triacylglycerol synthase family O-acyltransferase [Williamsia sterculiae]
MPITESMFLIAESREHPMHVGGLQLFTPPDGAGPDYVRSIVQRLRDQDEVSTRFRSRPADPVGILGNLWWTQDKDIDFEYHVRHSALPQPGRIRELLQLTSRWHGTLLDRHHPMWEGHVVEGLEDGRFALYTKMHHSLLDGVSALKTLERSLSTDPDNDDLRAPWTPNRSGKKRASGGSSLNPLSLASGALSIGGDALGLLPASAKVAVQAFRDHSYTVPFEAPRTILNGPIGGARRFVAQSWELERIKSVGAKVGATMNDVVLAMCGGALRDYLLELDALPDQSLTTMVPVSLRRDDDEVGGNRVGAIIASLATDIEDPLDRLIAVRQSVQSAKRVMSDLSPTQILALSALNISGLAFSPIPGFVSVTRPPFNVIISNVPGPRTPLYWNGSRLDGVYPASIVLDGQALNITLVSNNDQVDFGIIGCRQSLPSLQRLIHHLEDSLGEMEKAAS